MMLSELEELEDITHELVFEDEPSIFDDESAIELVETAMHLMDEYIKNNPNIISEPDFQEILLEEIQDIFYVQMEEQIETYDNGDDIEDDMNELIEDALKIFISTFYQDNYFNVSVNKPDDTLYDNA
jgi:hypothetical protein